MYLEIYLKTILPTDFAEEPKHNSFQTHEKRDRQPQPGAVVEQVPTEYGKCSNLVRRGRSEVNHLVRNIRGQAQISLHRLFYVGMIVGGDAGSGWVGATIEVRGLSGRIS